jgi:hypothetical protein
MDSAQTLSITTGTTCCSAPASAPPARIWSRDRHDRRDITTQFMFLALLRKAVNDEPGTWPEILVVFDGEEHGHGVALLDRDGADRCQDEPACVGMELTSGGNVRAVFTG